MRVASFVVVSAIAVTVAGCRGETHRASRNAAAASSCTPDSLRAGVGEVLQAMHRRNPVPGISVALFVPGAWREPLSVTVGTTHIEGGRQLRPDDKFLAGSVGKTFFAALALREASAGRLDLDQAVAMHLDATGIPALQWITPRMLLTHRSGIGEYDGVFMESLVREPSRVRVIADWLDVLRRTPPLRADTGKVRYSDVNFVLVAMLLDATVPEGAYAGITRDFLRPLHLDGTIPSVTPHLAGLVPGYDGTRSLFGRDAMMRGDSLVYNPQFEWGGGGFASTPSDLARWMAAFRLGGAFPDTLWPIVVARPAGVPDTSQRWSGLGIDVNHGALGATFEHSGYMPGYVSWMRWYESLGASIALQANASDTLRLKDDGYAWADSLAALLLRACVTHSAQATGQARAPH
ncbi:MAG: serine hydrolase domain-containing protein [Gemmatimonadota bacterium]